MILLTDSFLSLLFWVPYSTHEFASEDRFEPAPASDVVGIPLEEEPPPDDEPPPPDEGVSVLVDGVVVEEVVSPPELPPIEL